MQQRELTQLCSSVTPCTLLAASFHSVNSSWDPGGQQKATSAPNWAQPHLQLAYGVHRQGVGGDQRVQQALQGRVQ